MTRRPVPVPHDMGCGSDRMPPAEQNRAVGETGGRTREGKAAPLREPGRPLPRSRPPRRAFGRTWTCSCTGMSRATARGIRPAPIRAITCCIVDSEATRNNDDEFNLTANQTRLGFNIAGPESETMKASGKVEFDFFGNYASENKAKIQMRHAYMTLAVAPGGPLPDRGPDLGRRRPSGPEHTELLRSVGRRQHRLSAAAVPVDQGPVPRRESVDEARGRHRQDHRPDRSDRLGNRRGRRVPHRPGQSQHDVPVRRPQTRPSSASPATGPGGV